jgi:hypothetical protein
MIKYNRSISELDQARDQIDNLNNEIKEKTENLLKNSLKM